MVAMKHHLACRSLKLDGCVTISRETHEDGQQAKLLQKGMKYSGLDLEKEISPPVEAELFS
jgi:hypothetical protein